MSALIPVASCRPSPVARDLKPIHVEVLARSIAEIGLLQPIVVRAIPDGHEVMAGWHRLNAFKQLGRDEIPAEIRTDDDLHAELALIDENLIRNELTPAERAISIARRKAIYEVLHPETRLGENQHTRVRKVCEPSVERFTKATAGATGTSERKVQLEAQRGEAIGHEILSKVVGTSLDKGEELDALAKLSPERREQVVERAVAGDRVSAKVAVKKEKRDEREKALAGKIIALPDAAYGVAIEDFEWDHDPYNRETGTQRHPSNHYETAVDAHTPEEIVARCEARFRCLARDCIIFKWTTIPHLAIAVRTLELQGFTYKTHLVWHKLRSGRARGTGYWFTGEHEIVLVGVRGNVVPPATAHFRSLFEAPATEHSAKPDNIHEIIEFHWPNVPKVEFNARRRRSGWAVWGNEAQLPEEIAGGIASPPVEISAPPPAAATVVRRNDDEVLEIPAFLRCGPNNEINFGAGAKPAT